MNSIRVVILLLSLIHHECCGICRYGVNDDCAFKCFCASGQCDQETGACISGECRNIAFIGGIRRSGPGCLIDNVALGKPAYQVGTYKDQVASRAVDGNINPKQDTGYCAHPQSLDTNVPAWWYVDLGKTHKISEVIIFNILNPTYNNRMSQFTIRVGDSTDVKINPSCHAYAGPVPSAGNVTLSCDASGRYVGFLRDDDARVTKYLANLCEVGVMGYEKIGCSGCPTKCNDYSGCEKCDNGTRYPDCERECDYGFWGQNCEDRCSQYCKYGTTCDKVNGHCLEGCRTVTVDGTWRVGDRCAQHVDPISFSSTDEVDTTPVQVTSSSVTWRWKESRAGDITPYTAQYVGYYIYYRTTQDWSKTPGIPYQHGAEYQQGTVTGLRRNTSYEFDFSVYRIHEGQVYENAFRAVSGSLDGAYLMASTLGNKPTSTTVNVVTSTTTMPTPRVTPSSSTTTMPTTRVTPSPTDCSCTAHIAALAAVCVLATISLAGNIVFGLFVARKCVLNNNYNGKKTDDQYVEMNSSPAYVDVNIGAVRDTPGEVYDKPTSTES